MIEKINFYPVQVTFYAEYLVYAIELCPYYIIMCILSYECNKWPTTQFQYICKVKPYFLKDLKFH